MLFRIYEYSYVLTTPLTLSVNSTLHGSCGLSQVICVASWHIASISKCADADSEPDRMNGDHAIECNG